MNKIVRGQELEVNRIVKIFSDPLAEVSLEAEAILIERLSSLHLDGNLFWEKWKIKFLDEEDDDIYERYILSNFQV